jgi:hypothetical protein
MVEPATRTVFLASPGGLAAERETFRDVSGRLNATLGQQLGVQLVPVLWEDQRPGFGRPQDLINRRGDCADVFVGLLHRRWGSPTGRYSSGFEEEFDRAAARRRAAGRPEIMLAFKRVDDDSLADPGPQLCKVLEFRQAIEAGGELLYAQFDGLEEWRQGVTEWLTGYVVDVRARETVRAAEAGPADETAGAVARVVAAMAPARKAATVLRYYAGASLPVMAAVLDIGQEQAAALLDAAVSDVVRAGGQAATAEDAIALLAHAMARSGDATRPSGERAAAAPAPTSKSAGPALPCAEPPPPRAAPAAPVPGETAAEARPAVPSPEPASR